MTINSVLSHVQKAHASMPICVSRSCTNLIYCLFPELSPDYAVFCGGRARMNFVLSQSHNFLETFHSAVQCRYWHRNQGLYT